jgi:hypothetical protein
MQIESSSKQTNLEISAAEYSVSTSKFTLPFAPSIAQDFGHSNNQFEVSAPAACTLPVLGLLIVYG